MCKQAYSSHCSSARFIFVAFPSLTMKVERVAGPGWARRRSWGRQLPGAPIITTTSHFTSHVTRDTSHVTAPHTLHETRVPTHRWLSHGCVGVVAAAHWRLQLPGQPLQCCSAAAGQVSRRQHRNNKLTNYTGIMTTRRIGI